MHLSVFLSLCRYSERGAKKKKKTSIHPRIFYFHICVILSFFIHSFIFPWLGCGDEIPFIQPSISHSLAPLLLLPLPFHPLPATLCISIPSPHISASLTHHLRARLSIYLHAHLSIRPFLSPPSECHEKGVRQGVLRGGRVSR